MKSIFHKSKIFFFINFLLSAIFQFNAQTNPIVSAFFGLDNAMPIQANFLCPGASGMDGMPVNFLYPIDPTTLAASDFEVLDSTGTIHIPLCAVLAPANESGENRTVLLIGDLGSATTNPPVEVRVVGDVFTMNTITGESACSELINLNGLSTTNVVPLAEGPSLFFAQRIEGPLNECSSANQTIQVAWNGGVTPHITGDIESDLYQYYIGYANVSGVLVPHIPIAIADINDNDNFHQLCFSTTDTIVKISMLANTVEDPNQDPNLFCEIDVNDCSSLAIPEEDHFNKEYEVYPNPFVSEILIENLLGDENYCIRDLQGNTIREGKCMDALYLESLRPGIVYFTIYNSVKTQTLRLVKIE